MKNKKNIVLKILAGAIAAALIGGILFVTNSFIGNPVSAMFANRAIKQYIAQKYSYLDLKVEKASYNFKYGSYVARAESKTSIDTKFSIYYSKGKVQRDDYETYVLGMFNTLQRLSEEYAAVAKGIASKEIGYKINNITVLYNTDGNKKANDVLKLDMRFDKALPIDAEVTIGVDLTDASLGGIAKVLTDAHNAFVKNGCNFSKYGLYAENNGMLVMANGVTPEHIKSGELAGLLEKARVSDGANGISVFIKGEKK